MTSGRKRRLLCNGEDTGCVGDRQHHWTRKRADFPVVPHARELGKSAYATKQMTTQAAGAVSSEAAEWYAIDWAIIHRNVRRVQVRIAQLRRRKADRARGEPCNACRPTPAKTAADRGAQT